MPHCPFRVLNGGSWELQGEYGNEKGAKTAEQKNGARPVLILKVKVSHAVGGDRKGIKIKIGGSPVLPLGVKMSHAVGRRPKKGQNKNWRASCAVFRVEIE